MPDTPLNTDALEAANEAIATRNGFSYAQFSHKGDANAAVRAYLRSLPVAPLELTYAEWREFQAIPDQGYSHRAWIDARIAERVAVAQPVVTGEQINLAGWTCNGVHEPGDYSTCEECRDACDDLARFYNHMMQGTRPFKHWTGHPEVNDA